MQKSTEIGRIIWHYTKNSYLESKVMQKSTEIVRIIWHYTKHSYLESKVMQKSTEIGRKLEQSIKECSHDFQIWKTIPLRSIF